MAMSWVAEPTQKKISTIQKSLSISPKSRPGRNRRDAAIAQRAPAIHCRRSPKRSTSGDQRGLIDQARYSPLTAPMVARETPWSRK